MGKKANFDNDDDFYEKTEINKEEEQEEENDCSDDDLGNSDDYIENTFIGRYLGRWKKQQQKRGIEKIVIDYTKPLGDQLNDPGKMEKFLYDCLPYLFWLIKKSGIKDQHELNDLIQDCLVFLLEINDKFDPLKGSIFTFIIACFLNILRKRIKQNSSEINASYFDYVNDDGETANTIFDNLNNTQILSPEESALLKMTRAGIRRNVTDLQENYSCSNSNKSFDIKNEIIENFYKNPDLEMTEKDFYTARGYTHTEFHYHKNIIQGDLENRLDPDFINFSSCGSVHQRTAALRFAISQSFLEQETGTIN